MNFRDTLERMFWTVVSAAGSSLIAAAVLDVDAGKAAVVAGGTAAINFVTIVARARLAVLPDPGAGLG
jgi:hypothetical protein